MERSLVLFQEALSAAEFRINWEISDMQLVHAFWNALLGAHQSASLSPIERYCQHLGNQYRLACPIIRSFMGDLSNFRKLSERILVSSYSTRLSAALHLRCNGARDLTDARAHRGASIWLAVGRMQFQPHGAKYKSGLRGEGEPQPWPLEKGEGAAAPARFQRAPQDKSCYNKARQIISSWSPGANIPMFGLNTSKAGCAKGGKWADEAIFL
jgi:hypothetical protein